MLDFPNNPTNGQRFTDPTAGTTWMWDSQKWLAAGTSFYLPLIGGTLTGNLFLADRTLLIFNNGSYGPPAFTTRSVGTKIILWSNISPTTVDYAIGMDGGTLWFSVPGGTGGSVFQWYGGTTPMMTLSAGSLTLAGNLTVGGSIAANGQISAPGLLATGTGAQVAWADRTNTGQGWLWYSTGGTARLYNGGDRFWVDANGQGTFTQGVYAAAFAIGGTGHFLYDAGSGTFTIRAGPSSGPYGYFNFQSNGVITATELDTAGWGIRYNGFSDGVHGFGFGWDGAHVKCYVDGGGAVLTLANVGDIYNIVGGYLPLGGGRMTGQIGTSGSLGAISQSSLTTGLMVYGNGGTGDASYLIFHRPSQYAIAFGLDTDNQMAWGGWSMGAARRVLWDTGNFNPGNYLPIGGGTLSGSLTTNGIFVTTGGQVVIYNSTTIGFHVQNANGDWVRMYDDSQPHIETSGSTLYLNYTNGATVYTGGQIQCNDLYSRNNLNCAGSIGGSGHYLYLNGWGNGNVNSTGGPFIYADGSWIIPHLGPGNAGFAIQATGGNDVFTVDGAGNTTAFGDLHTNHQIFMPGDNWLWQGGRASILQSSDGNFYIGDAGAGWNTRLRGATVYVDGGGFRVNNNDNCRTVCANGSHARWWYEVSGTRLWSQGCVSWGSWYLADESAGAVRMDIDVNGRLTHYGEVAMPNNTYLWFKDTNGSVRYGLILANDNQYYLSDGNINVIVRAPNIYLQGYVQGNGNIYASGSLGSNGIWFGNSGGWWWTGSPIHTDSDIQCNSLYFGGCRIYNSGGYAYFDQTVHAAGVYSRGDIWNAGNINSGNQVNGAYIHSTGDARCDGSYTCGGWYYGGGNGGAQIRCWAGDWGAMSYAMSQGYFEVSPDQGVSGFVLQPVTSWSDARLKLNIRDSEINALAILCAIPVRAFDWTPKGRELMPQDNGPSVSCGLVAQEVEELIPSAVNMVPVIGDFASEGMRCLASEQLHAYYIRAIQQLNDRIEELEVRLAA